MTSEPLSDVQRVTLPATGVGARQLPVRVAFGLAALIGFGLAYYHWRWEGWRETILFAGGITTVLVAVLTLTTRRLLFSIAIIAAFVAIIVKASDVKRQYIDMVLHAYDVVFYLTSWSTITYLWEHHSGYLLALAGSFAAILLFGRMLYLADSTRVHRATSAAVMVTAIGIATWASYAKGSRANTLFFWDNLYVSSFYSSWSETIETLWRGQLMDAATTQPKPLFSPPASCATEKKPPHIILIHQESVVQPSLFPEIGYDRSLDGMFTSFDGKLHKLRVETYGGASWLTEFSVVAGVSTYSFGGMRTFVQSLMQGKVHDTLPQNLTRCGYRNSVFYPVPKDFVSNGKFYAASGMPEIFDFKGQNATRYNERDGFYYGNVVKHIGEHIKTSEKPTFSFVITSATHLPYTFAYEPQVSVSAGGPNTPPEMGEYLRRLAMAKIDYDAFRKDLAEKFPDQQFLIVHYGDHQPIATRTLLGLSDKMTAEDVKLTPESPGLTTYYRIDAVNYAPPPMPEVDMLEVPYIGAVLLQAAGLPLSEATQERLRLLKHCDGRYFTCADRGSILAFHRRLIDSGLIDAR
jgi:hypothetical protein